MDFRCCRSVHNQRIECIWGDVRKDTLRFCMDVLSSLSGAGLYDEAKATEGVSLTLVYQQTIQTSLNQYGKSLLQNVGSSERQSKPRFEDLGLEGGSRYRAGVFVLEAMACLVREKEGGEDLMEEEFAGLSAAAKDKHQTSSDVSQRLRLKRLTKVGLRCPVPFQCLHGRTRGVRP